MMRASCAAYSARDLSSDQAMSSCRRIDLSDINLAAYNMRPAKHDQWDADAQYADTSGNRFKTIWSRVWVTAMYNTMLLLFE